MNKYFDYAATTPPSQEALNAYVETSQNVYGNPGSSLEAKKLEQEVHEKMLELLNMSDEYELIFTSGGTEANNLAISGTILKNFPQDCHVITSLFEHASIYETFQSLKPNTNISFVKVDKEGYIDIEDFKSLLTPKTKFVSFMHVNNELGTKQNIEKLYEITKKYNDKIVFMVDEVQGIGKVERLTITPDIFTISSHKVYGPKSVGAVIKKKDIKLQKMIFGGTKENGYRGGTQSLPAQVGFLKALEKITNSSEEVLSKVTMLKQYLEKEIVKIDKINLNSISDSNVVSINTDIDIPARIGLNWFREKGFSLSSKSADTNNLRQKSRTLKAIGLSDYKADRTYRISLSHHKTIDELDELIKGFEKFISEQSTTLLKEISNTLEFQEHIKLRKNVFVKEQKIDLKEEIDKYDWLNKYNDLNKYDELEIYKTEEIDKIIQSENVDVKHYNFCQKDKTIGTVRVIISSDKIKIGRVVIDKEYRKQNLGEVLIQKVMQELDDFEKKYYIESQEQVIEFYEKLGFKQFGEKFLDCNIVHVKMVKQK